MLQGLWPGMYQEKNPCILTKMKVPGGSTRQYFSTATEKKRVSGVLPEKHPCFFWYVLQPWEHGITWE